MATTASAPELSSAQQHAHPGNVHQAPELTSNGPPTSLANATASIHQPLPTPSPPPDDLDAEIDTRKHMEAPRNAEGKMICIRPGCEAMRFDRKCEWSKHMDKHDRPYRCLLPSCTKLKGFTYSGGLLRHQREVHKAHGGPKDTLNCPIPYCKRNAGPGFTRKENLNEHIRRVHRQPVPKEEEPVRRERRGRRRVDDQGRADGSGIGGTDIDGAHAMSASGEGNGTATDVPVDDAIMSMGAAPPAPMAPSEDQGQEVPMALPQQQQHPQQEEIEAEQSGMTAEQVRLSNQQQQQQQHGQASTAHVASVHNGGNVANVASVAAGNHAIAPEFQVPGLMDAAGYELAFLRQEVEKLRRENEDKDERIARLEAKVAGRR